MTLLHTRLDRRRLASTIGLAGLLATVGPRVANAQRSPFGPATPVATTSAADGPLGRLLAMVPLATIDGVTNGIPWTYADLAAQFAALAMHHDLAGPDPDEPIANATLALTSSSPLMAFGLDEELNAALGFNPLGLDQILYVGDAGSQVQLFAAPFDAGVVQAAWDASGYQQVDPVAGVIAWTIGPDAEIEFDHPVQGRVISSMNNLALVDGVVIATPTLSGLQSVLEFIGSGGLSLLDDPVMAPLIATLPDTFASAMAFLPADPAFQAVDPDAESLQEAERAAIESEMGPMPPLLGGITAVGAGAFLIESNWSESGTREETVRPDAGAAFLRLGTATPADAAQALAVIEQRWARLHSVHSHLSYAEIMEIVQGTVDGDVVELDFRQVLQPQAWRHLIESGDLLPFVPDAQ